MARLHSLMAWSVVFGFFTAAGLCAAEQNRPKSPPEKPKLQRSDDPFGGAEMPAKASVKKPPKPAVKQMRPCEIVAAIEEALTKPVQMDFSEQPLQDVIEYLNEQHRIQIKIDNGALRDAGIGTDSPVTISLKGISLRSALNIMLRELSLTWIIQDEVLTITTPEEADSHLLTRLYDVADLVVCRDDHDVLWDDYDALIDIITATVKPTAWDAVGGAGAVKGNTLGTARVLVIAQTRDVHEQVADLLAKIREIARRNPNAGTPRRNRSVPMTSQKHATTGGLGSDHGSTNPRPTGDLMPTWEKQKQPPTPDVSKKAPGAAKPALKGHAPKPNTAEDKGTGMF